MSDEQPKRHQSEESERRKFLGRAGKIALTVPPTIALLLAAERRHYVFAQSGRGRGDGNGNGNGNSQGNNNNNS
jgi:hypothetical protein